jgi:hypothetical protein
MHAKSGEEFGFAVKISAGASGRCSGCKSRMFDKCDLRGNYRESVATVKIFMDIYPPRPGYRDGAALKNSHPGLQKQSLIFQFVSRY